MYQAGTDTALDDQVSRPLPRPTPPAPFRLSDLAKAPFQGIGSGTAKTIAFGSEIAGAFGQVAGAYPEVLGVTELTDQQRAQSQEQRRKLLEKGVDFSNEAGDTFRTRSREIMPDPQATHASAQVVAGLTEFATQAIGYSVAAGPVAGAGLTGVDVGMSEADRLKLAGVDEATRTKAGAAAGAIATGTMLVPLSGPNWLVRGGIGVAAGEAGTVGTSLAEKKILEASGYQAQADSFDPFDPVALALGVIPGVIGARFGKPRTIAPKPVGELRTEADIRRAATLTPEERARESAFERSAQNLAELEAAIKAEKNPESRALLEAELQKQRTAAAGEVADRALQAVPDVEPAVRVRASAEALEASRLTPEGDIAGADAHLSAVELAGDQLGRGDPVAVTDVVGPSLRELEASNRMATDLAQAVDRAVAGDVGRSVEMLRSEAGRLREAADAAPTRDIAARARTAADMLETLAASRSGQPVETPATRLVRTADAVDQLRGVHPAEQMRAELAGVADTGIPKVPRSEPPKAPAAPAGKAAKAQKPSGQGAARAGAAERSSAPSLSQAATEVTTLNPDMLVHMDDLPAGMRAGDLLARIREEAAADAKESRLIEVAVACGLRS